jgi:hypothetical protein
MACDLATLATLDTQDVEQMLQAIDQCTRVVFDPRMWIWALVLTVVCGAVGALIGKRKNAVVRDTILGAALGPIGWIISLCLPVAKPTPRCPACKRDVDAGDAHCRHCGAKLRKGNDAARS